MNPIVSPDTAILASLQWVLENDAPLFVSHVKDGGWACLRSKMLQLDSEHNLLKIMYPLLPMGGPAPEIAPSDRIGISFRRGHKKCSFVSAVAMRCHEGTGEDKIDALVLRVPSHIREMQRRVYQRVQIPAERFIAAKLFAGGLPKPGENALPICSGRVDNISVGGVLVDIRADQNPRLNSGSVVGIEIMHKPGLPPILTEASYLHCALRRDDRLGLGLQFLGLEHEMAGRSTLADVADFVRRLRAECGAVAVERRTPIEDLAGKADSRHGDDE